MFDLSRCRRCDGHKNIVAEASNISPLCNLYCVITYDDPAKLPLCSEYSPIYKLWPHFFSQKDKLDLHLGSIPWLLNSRGYGIFPGTTVITGTGQNNVAEARTTASPHLESGWGITYDHPAGLPLGSGSLSLKLQPQSCPELTHWVFMLDPSLGFPTAVGIGFFQVQGVRRAP